ncbi:GAF and ANTAR domain-containing protein [Actinosynnema sp. CA-299493]
MGTGQDESWPPAPDEVADALTRLTAALDGLEDLPAALDRMCKQVTRAIPGVDEVSVTLLTDGRPGTAAATADVVVELDRVQYALDRGPCLEAIRTGALVRSSITDAADRWPPFARDAEAAGFGSFLSVPLSIDIGHAGSINCYSRAGHGFTDLDEKLLDLYTATATAALLAHSRYRDAVDTTERLRAALDHPSVIDQAKGILMATHRISADEATRLLVEQSQRDDTAVHDLAVRLVADITSTPPRPTT